MARVVSYLREVRGELRKVFWPTRRETVVYTIVVLISVMIVALMIWAMDILLGELMRLIIRG